MPAVGCVSIVRIIFSAESVLVPWPCLANRVDRAIGMRYCVHMGSYLDHLGWWDGVMMMLFVVLDERNTMPPPYHAMPCHVCTRCKGDRSNPLSRVRVATVANGFQEI